MDFFLCLCLSGILYHDIFPVLIALRFDLAEPNLWREVFCVTYNTSESLLSYFIALGLFTGTDVLNDIRMFYVSPSGVDTIASTRIALYFC